MKKDNTASEGIGVIDMQERTPYPKYQACPCGSGQKYKFCCFTKGFHYLADDDSEVASAPDLDVDDTKKKMIELMRSTGIRPVLIYAYEKTGLMVTEKNKRLIPDGHLEEWYAAVEEYYELHPEEDPRTT